MSATPMTSVTQPVTSSSDLESVLDKIRKLMRLAQGEHNNSAHEAAAAAAKAQELIDRYQIAQAMLALDAPSSVADEAIEDFGQKDAPLDTLKQLDRWRSQLAMGLARRNACKVYATGATMHIIGRASDAETVRYLYAYFVRQIDRLTDDEGKGCGRTWRNNFRIGVVDTIGRRLREQQEQTIRAVRREAGEQANASMALVRVNSAIATVHERHAAVERWAKDNLNLYSRGGSGKGLRPQVAEQFPHAAVERWAKDNLKLYSRGGSQSRVDPLARQQGRKAGERVRLADAKGSLTSAAKGLPRGGAR